MVLSASNLPQIGVNLKLIHPELNYISVRASAGATIEEIDNGGTIIIVTLDKCPPNGKVTFVYGTGTGARRVLKRKMLPVSLPSRLNRKAIEFGRFGASHRVIRRKRL